MSKFKFEEVLDIEWLNINDILDKDIYMLPFFFLKHELFFKDELFTIWKLSDFHNIYLIKTPEDYDQVRNQLKYYFNNNIDIYRITSKANIFSDLKTLYITETPYLSNILQQLYLTDKEKFYFITNTISTSLIKLQEKNKNYNKNNIMAFYNSFEKIRMYFMKSKFSYSHINFNLNQLFNIECFENFNQLTNSIKNINKNKNKRFNDSDFEFFTIDEDLFLMDYSSNNFYMIKKEKDSYRVYFKSRDTMILPYDDDINIDAINDLLYENKQIFFIFKEQLNESNLIAEFNNNDFLFLIPKFSNLILNLNFILGRIKIKKKKEYEDDNFSIEEYKE